MVWRFLRRKLRQKRRIYCPLNLKGKVKNFFLVKKSGNLRIPIPIPNIEN